MRDRRLVSTKLLTLQLEQSISTHLRPCSHCVVLFDCRGDNRRSHAVRKTAKCLDLAFPWLPSGIPFNLDTLQANFCGSLKHPQKKNRGASKGNILYEMGRFAEPHVPVGFIPETMQVERRGQDDGKERNGTELGMPVE